LRERNEVRELLSFETLIAHYRYIRGLISDGRDGLERALALGADEGFSHVGAYCSCSDFARLQGDHEKAKQHAETALTLARRAGVLDDLGLALKQLGIVEMSNDLERAVALLEESLAIRRAGGSSRDLATSLNNLAEANRLRNEYGAAISYLREALEVCDVAYDVEGLAITSMNLAQIELQAGQHRSAAEHLRVALKHATAIGWLEMVARALTGAAAIAHGRGLYKAGAQLVAVAERIFAEKAIHLDPEDRDGLQKTKSLLEHELGRAASEASARTSAEMSWEEASALAQDVASLH
jgi:tetratricopeptide (TPR) repeat protein